ncbi:MAG: hypothetical protein DRJ51_06205 [Thermoprotei archaeon]|nr:MAG: hypothetical protein DRJ51_06205 [Thermoprotei archaeon]RLF02329.1 MAG: hypothetical protein DRJ59_03890 [Thermoprotei archaeon]
MKYYCLKPPTEKPSWNYFLLYTASRLKRFYKGTYYIPGRTLLPVFVLPRRLVDWRAFEEVSPRVLRESFKMICVNCGLCCMENCGAFMFSNEYFETKASLGLDVILPYKTVRASYVGELQVYALDVEARGRCYFYSFGEGCRLKKAKPIICLIHYCTLLAEKGGRKYVKVSVKKTNSGDLPIYRAVSDERFKEIVAQLKEKALRKAWTNGLIYEI